MKGGTYIQVRDGSLILLSDSDLGGGGSSSRTVKPSSTTWGHRDVPWGLSDHWGSLKKCHVRIGSYPS